MTSVLVLALATLNAPSLLDHAIHEWKRTPEMRIEDAYKWLFQATIGGEHAVKDESGPRAWLDSEWKSLSPPLPGETLIEKLDFQGRLVRINLRPYKNSSGDKETLLRIFISSAQQFRADKKDFLNGWKALGSRLRKRPIGKITFRAWNDFDKKARSAGYPAVHHSPEYEKRYRPAYRVVVGALWSKKL